MGGSARYRQARKIREGKITAEDLSYAIYTKYPGDRPSDLYDEDFKIYGFDEDGNSYEVDKHGNPVKLASPKFEKEWTFIEASEANSLKDARRKLEELRKEPEHEYDAGEDWWDNGGKEATLYGL